MIVGLLLFIGNLLYFISFYMFELILHASVNCQHVNSFYGDVSSVSLLFMRK
jgi:hypothetical protein